MSEQAIAQIDTTSIPAGLKNHTQYVVWRKEQFNAHEKPKKVPYDPRTGRRASTVDPTTWADFDTACLASKQGDSDGIGFVFTKEDPYCGIDIDNCRNPETGKIEQGAQDIVTAINSYTEVSPSGTGLHVIANATLPGGGRKADHIEIYDQGRYFTVTGNHLAGTSQQIHKRQREIEGLYFRLFGSTRRIKQHLVSPSTPAIADEEVLQRARLATHGDKFQRLYSGDYSGYGSQSQADLALCSLLAYYSGGNAEQIDRLFRQSDLYREKWDQKHFSDGRTYGEGTIEKALASGATMNVTSNSGSEKKPWWPQLDKAALYGLAGEIAQAFDPHTEADPVALLAHFLSEFSALIGKGPRIKLGSGSMPLIFNIVVVGQTSKARKGTAEKEIRHTVRTAIPEWTRGECRGNLSSGEGLVWAVRDPDGDDRGIKDKRLFLVQAEFGSVLKIMSREGNSLSGVIRDAWDGEDLAPMTKNSRIRATSPHIVIAGHVTVEELKKHLTSTEACNGFGNRLVWLLVRRSKTLPFPDEPDERELVPLRRRLQEAVEFARVSRHLKMTDKAKEAWRAVYPDLSEGRPGMVGALLGRAEAQVMRLAGLYALLDKSHCIKRVHLEAALSLWQYAEDSVEYLFGDTGGDRVADKLLDEIRRCGQLTDAEISGLFKGNIEAERLKKAKQHLQSRKLIQPKTEDSGGRPRRVWTLVP